jgi:hypothetical protein
MLDHRRPRGIEAVTELLRADLATICPLGEDAACGQRVLGAGNFDRRRMFAREFIGLQPDVILAHGTPVTAALQRETRTIAIVFVTVGDPVGDRFVASLSRPGGNLTGFVFAEAAMGGKWLELLLTETVPGLKRVAIMFNPETAPGRGSYDLRSFEAAAEHFKVEPIAARVQGDADIETAITSLGRRPKSGSSSWGIPSCWSTAGQPYCLLRKTKYRGSTFMLSSPKKAVCFPTGRTTGTYSVVPPPMWIRFSVARSRLSFPFRCRQNLK